MNCPDCGPLDYNEVLADPDDENLLYCGLCGEDLPIVEESR